MSLSRQVAMLAPFAGVDRPQEKRRGIAVQVEVDETAIFLDVLLAHGAQEVALAAAGLADHDHMPHALTACESHFAARYALIHHAMPKN